MNGTEIQLAANMSILRVFLVMGCDLLVLLKLVTKSHFFHRGCQLL
jgi:hypothetical protein